MVLGIDFCYTVLLKYQGGQIKQWENCCQLPMLGSDRLKCVKTRNMGITWMCEILIIMLFVILMVVTIGSSVDYSRVYD